MEAFLKAVGAVVTVAGALFGAYTFFKSRRNASFLTIDLTPEIVAVSSSTPGRMQYLVDLCVHLENKGEVMIRARVPDSPGGRLYDDEWDVCDHPGTLKIREVAAPAEAPHVFDWYCLPKLDSANQRCRVTDRLHQVAITMSDLEQINYLGEYQNPADKFATTDFWLEPKESYELRVPIWLPAGVYAAKAIFLGERTDPGEEEFWTSTRSFAVPGEKRS